MVCISYFSFHVPYTVAYREEHGDVEVPAGYTGEKEGGKQLDNWIGRQRRLFRDEKLPTDLINKLEQLGVNLKGRGRPFGYESEESWNSNYDDMMAYYEQHGNCDVAESTREWECLVYSANGLVQVPKLTFLVCCFDRAWRMG